jgi:hypothetical protein
MQRTIAPRKADKIRIVHAEATAGAGNLLHTCRAIDETVSAKAMIAKNYPCYMKNMTLAVSPEDSIKRGRRGTEIEFPIVLVLRSCLSLGYVSSAP